jgi:tripartite-type tricarboxylate transporter receptor subunit TctC
MTITAAFSRNTLFAAAFITAGMACAQTAGVPQGYPSRPIRLMVSQAAGGPTDVVARIYSTRMSELLGQQLVVDNRQSSGGAIAGEITVRAPADGYTLLVAANGTIAVAPHLVKLTFDARKDLVPVALIGNSPLGLMVHPPMPVQSVKELLARAKARPGTINFASSGLGATSHLAGEMLKMMAGINIVHVPYKGAGPALIGLMSGEIEMMISGLSSGMPYVKQKQLRLLAVSSAKRVSLLPDMPAISETVPGYEVGSWYAVFATAGTPRAVVEHLHRTSVKAISTPEVGARLVAAGVDLEMLTPEKLAAKIDQEWERWGKVTRASGMKQQ